MRVPGLVVHRRPRFKQNRHACFCREALGGVGLGGELDSGLEKFDGWGLRVVEVL